MNKIQARQIGEKIVALVKKEFPDCVVESVGGIYGDSYSTTKIKVTVPDEGGKIVTTEEKDFKLYAKQFGLEPDDFGKTFTAKGDVYTIIGLQPSKRKYAIITKSSNGKRYGWSAVDVKHSLEKQAV